MWIFSCAVCITETCVRFLTPGAHPLSRRACVHLFWLSGGLCALVSASWGCTLHPGACVDLFHSPCLPQHGRRVYMHLFCLTTCPLGVICSLGCARRFACTAQFCMPPLYQHPGPGLCTGGGGGGVVHQLCLYASHTWLGFRSYVQIFNPF